MNSRHMIAILIALVLSGSITAQEDSPRFLGKDLDTWKKQLHSADPSERHLAAWAISQVGEFRDLEEGLLKNADPVVKHWCIQGLGRVAGSLDEKQARELAGLLFHFTHPPATRIAAAEQLARLAMIPDVKPAVAQVYLAEAIPILTAALDEPQESAAIQAAAALAALGKRAAPARSKLQQAEKNGGEYVKRLAARALANLDQE